MIVSDQQLCEDLFELLGQVKLQMLFLAEAQGLTSTQLLALYVIDQHHGELVMHEAAKVLHCDASNVTGIMDRLVNQQLIERKEGAHDRRTKVLGLTDKGRQTIQKLKDGLPERMRCELISDDERTVLHDVIRKLCS
ncbi:MAG TPA: MarR family transcriptional regulator [Patescibacteria group bacterium]|nr:MarR family transcriptional regulator [Patescibacteria group bacterium]